MQKKSLNLLTSVINDVITNTNALYNILIEDSSLAWAVQKQTDQDGGMPQKTSEFQRF